MKTLGEKIAFLRKERKLSQETLGLEIGVSRSAIVKWEKGLMNPNHDSLNLLCEYFKVDANYFYEGDVTGNNNNEFAITNVEHKSNKKYIIVLILFSVIFLISMIITVLYAFSVFSNNTGYTKSNTTAFDDVIFYIGLCLSVISLVIVLISIIKLKKCNK